MLIVLNQD